jgi:hypothetical protein
LISVLVIDTTPRALVFLGVNKERLADSLNRVFSCYKPAEKATGSWTISSHAQKPPLE